MKDLLHRLKGANGGQDSGSTQRSLSLAAFGKHPGWDDHIPGIGLDTETLAYVKQTLYVAGIGGQIDSGAWEKLDWDKRLPGFDHVFLWSRPGTTLLGQFWSSTDRKGRAKYPMVVCAQGDGLDAAWMLDKLPPGLERLRDACRATPSADAVTNYCKVAQDQLRSLLNAGPAQSPSAPGLEERKRFFENEQLGPNRVGFLRVLHELSVATSITGRTRGAEGDAHLRVPVAASSRNEGLLLWLAFLRAMIPESVPVLLLSRSGTDWFDIIIGEPSPDNFYCLQTSDKAQPFSTAIPYDLAAELPGKFGAIESRMLGQQPAPAPAAAPSQPKTVLPAETTAPAEKKPAAPPAAAPAPPEPKARSKTSWFIGGAVVVALAAGAFVFMDFGQRSPGPLAKAPEQPPPKTQAEAQPGALYQEAMTAAQGFLKNGDFSNALARAEAALSAKPGDPAATRVASEAGQAIQTALARFTDYAKATNAALAAFARQDFLQATNQAAMALKLKPDDAEMLTLVAKAQERVKASLAEQLETKYRGATNAAFAALTSQDFAEATRQAQLALSLKANDAGALSLAALAAKGQQAFELAAQREKDFQRATNLAGLALAAGKLDEAAKQAKAAHDLKPADAMAAALSAETDRRIQSAGIAVQKDKDFEAAVAAARTAFDARDFPGAIAQANRALELKPGDAAASKLLADARVVKKEQDQVAELAQKLETVLNAARQAFAASNYDAAISEARAALVLKPGDTAAAALIRDSELAKAAAEKPTVAAAAVLPVIAKATAPEGSKAPWTNDLGMEFVWVPSLGGGAYVGKYEVTQEQYRKVMGDVPEQLTEDPDIPVSNVPYKSALEFCTRLSAKGNGRYALPTREEWLTFAGLVNVAEQTAWQAVTNRLRSETTSYGVSHRKPQRGGSSGIPEGGIADVLGNVREWVEPETSMGFAFDASRGSTTVLALKTGPWLQSRTGFRCLLRDPK
jgi:formylglycine-generating enzyme required for sulfatase activity